MWDICFLAIDPVRAEQILFTPPYVVIEGAYLVAEGSPIRDNAEVDRPGVRLLVSTGSAYDLFLSRTIRHATIVRTVAAKDVVDVFVAQKLDVAAGVRPLLEADAQRVPGLRLLPGRFMAINQAMGTPRGREIAAAYLRTFIEEHEGVGLRRAVARAQPRRRRVGRARRHTGLTRTPYVSSADAAGGRRRAGASSRVAAKTTMMSVTAMMSSTLCRPMPFISR